MNKSLGRKVGHGQTAELFKWKGDRVLKLFNEGMTEKNAQREASIGGSIYGRGLPVPKVFDVIKLKDRHGIIFEYVEGSTMLQLFSKKPWKVKSLITQFSQLHVDMHKLQPKGLLSQRAEIERLIRDAPLPQSTVKKSVSKVSYTGGWRSTVPR